MTGRQAPLGGAPLPLPLGTPLVEGRGLIAERGGRRVLDGVDVTVHAGELVALVGPNGAGKSTVLAVFAGDLAPAGGQVLVDGRPLPEWRDDALARRRAVLPQRTTVGFPFPVEEVVRMGRAPWRRTAEAAHDERIVADAISAVGLGPLAHRSVLALSGGELARTALARVLAQRTQLLLLDEPTAALDVHHEELTLQLVRERVDAGGGAAVVLHDLGLAAAHADRVVVVDAGRVVAAGPPDAVLEPALLSHVYQHPIEVLAHPRTGTPLVLVQRRPGAPSHPRRTPP